MPRAPGIWGSPGALACWSRVRSPNTLGLGKGLAGEGVLKLQIPTCTGTAQWEEVREHRSRRGPGLQALQPALTLKET